MTTCKEWMKTGSLETFQNGVHLKDEEREDLEIRGCGNERERGELTTWNGSTEKVGEEK